MPVSRRSQIPPFHALEVLAEANALEAAGRHIIHMEVGQPSTGAPAPAIRAARAALDGPAFGYTEGAGQPALRRRIAAHYRSWYGLEIPIERILITHGASGCFTIAFLAAFDAGARVAMAEPGYTSYRNVLKALDIEVVSIETGPESRFQPTIAHLEALDKPIDGLIVASPSNPTSTTLKPEELEALVRYCEAKGITLISDEIYHGLTYGRPTRSALNFSQAPIVVNSFSKYFAMTGWRMGWMILPEDMARTGEKLAQNFFLSPSAVAQIAATAAFDGYDEAEIAVKRYAENRRVLLEGLPKVGLGRIAPIDGAFYVWADISDYSTDSIDFCRRMLHEAGIAATPGVDFDPFKGHHYLRMAFAGSTEDMVQVVDRLDGWMRRSFGVGKGA